MDLDDKWEDLKAMVREGSVGEMETLLNPLNADQRCTLLMKRVFFGETVFHKAVGSQPKVSVSDTGYCNGYQLSPLVLALRESNSRHFVCILLTLIALLILLSKEDQIAIVNMRDNNGCTPVHLASTWQSPEISASDTVIRTVSSNLP